MGFVKIRQRKPIGRNWPPLLWICPFLLVAVVFTLVDSCSVRERALALARDHESWPGGESRSARLSAVRHISA